MNLMIKPVSYSCDLACAYCFYRAGGERSQGGGFLMGKEVLDGLFARCAGYDCCSFVFQGGEPLLAGRGFFEEVFERQRQSFVQYGTRFENSIQTNGQALDAGWAEFFAKNHILAGLSIDGPCDLHDKYRGEGSFSKALAAAERLRFYGAEFNILSVVGADSVSRAGEIYAFFREQGFLFQQYIPLVAVAGAPLPPLTAEVYAEFFCGIFDLWYADMLAGNQIFVRNFEELAAAIAGVGRAPSLGAVCGFGGCAEQFVLERGGEVFPCDFFCERGRLLGDVGEEDIFSRGGAFRGLAGAGRQCGGCRWVSICGGGCLRQREEGRFIYCEGMKAILDHAAGAIAGLLSERGISAEIYNKD